VKRGSICRRLSCRRNPTAPAASTPCTWKTGLAKSSPIIVTWMAPDARAAYPTWHTDAVRGPPPKRREGSRGLLAFPARREGWGEGQPARSGSRNARG